MGHVIGIVSETVGSAQVPWLCQERNQKSNHTIPDSMCKDVDHLILHYKRRCTILPLDLRSC